MTVCAFFFSWQVNLEVFEALKNYFVNQSKCSTLSLHVFVSLLNPITLFSQNHLEIFKQSIQRMSTSEDFRKIKSLQTKLANRRTVRFIYSNNRGTKQTHGI